MSTITTNKLRSQTIIQPTTPIFGLGKDISNPSLKKRILSLIFYGIQGWQNEQEIFVGKVRLKDFLENANWKADTWDNLKKGSSNGYQRNVQTRRADDFGRYMAKHEKNFTPSALYLNIRDVDMGDVTTSKAPGAPENSGLYKITVDKKAKIYVVDGQHRVEGLRSIGNYSDDPNIELPVVLTIGLSKAEEMIQFVTINKARASVKTDLAERDLADFVARDRKFGASLLQRDNVAVKDLDFIRNAVSVLDGLYESPGSPWHYRILMPNTKKSQLTNVSSATFVDSLEPLMKENIGKSMKKPQAPLAAVDEVNIIKHLNAVWKGIKDVNPKMFEKQNACKYVIQHTIGTMVIHLVLHRMHINGKTEKLRKATAEDYRKLFSISAIKTSKDWDKEFGDFGGQYTRMGTNKKSFNYITSLIWKEIKNTQLWKNQYSE